MEKLPATIEELAAMINTHTASEQDITEVKQGKPAVEGRLTTRLDRIEHLLLATQAQRLNDLETRMKKLEDALTL